MNRWLILILLHSCFLTFSTSCNGAQADMSLEELAEQHFNSGQWREAATRYLALLKQTPDSATYWQRLGASELNLKRFDAAINAYQKAVELVSGPAKNRIYFALARAEAGKGSVNGVVEYLSYIAAAGGTPYQAVMNTPELMALKGEESFEAVLLLLRPCQTAEHRAFDFWLGNWKVTSPGREGWSATSSITLGNDGCTVHEAYTTPGGYAGTSVNFYDAANKKWHQTWVDNQGGPLYLDGAAIENGMQLGDGANRITWTKQSDNQVRQHWQVTNDDGKTYTTAFDGYYERTNP